MQDMQLSSLPGDVGAGYVMSVRGCSVVLTIVIMRCDVWNAWLACSQMTRAHVLWTASRMGCTRIVHVQHHRHHRNDKSQRQIWGLWCREIDEKIIAEMAQAFASEFLVPNRRAIAKSPAIMGSSDDQRKKEWAEALRPRKKTRVQLTGARVDESSALAIAKSHGVHTSWDEVFAKEGLISNTGGDGADYRAKT